MLMTSLRFRTGASATASERPSEEGVEAADANENDPLLDRGSAPGRRLVLIMGGGNLAKDQSDGPGSREDKGGSSDWKKS